MKCNGYHNVAYLLHAEQIFEQLFFHLLLWVYKVGKQTADLMDYESRLYKMFFYVKVCVMCVQNQLNEN